MPGKTRLYIVVNTSLEVELRAVTPPESGRPSDGWIFASVYMRLAHECGFDARQVLGTIVPIGNQVCHLRVVKEHADRAHAFAGGPLAACAS